MNMKKACSIVLVITLLISLARTPSQQVYAASSNEFNYVNSIAATYLKANHLYGSISFSDAYPIYDLESSQTHKNIYFFIKGDKIIASLIVSKIKDQYFSSFSTNYLQEFNNIFTNNIPSVLCSHSGYYILHSEKSNLILSRDDYSRKIDINALNYSNTATYIIEGSHSIYINSIQPMYTYNYLYVTPVSNGYDPYNGAGLCWAACVAAKTNYQAGTSLSAIRVLNDCINNTTQGEIAAYGRPSGSVHWINRAFSFEGLSTTNMAGGLTISQITAQLSSNKPIFMYLTNGQVSHTILVIGVYADGSTNVYYVMDPNQGSIVSINVSQSALSNPSYFSYITSTQTYSTWYWSFY